MNQQQMKWVIQQCDWATIMAIQYGTGSFKFCHWNSGATVDLIKG